MEAENLVEINYLTLKQLMRLDPQVGIIIEKPDVSDALVMAEPNLSLQATFDTAKTWQPGIIANELRLKGLTLMN